MADPKFDYPDSSSPTTTITFTEGGRLVKDAMKYTNPNQIKKRTKDNELLSWNYGSGKRVYPFTARVKMDSETEADIEDILDFLENCAEWSNNSFVWTDKDGTARTVKLLDDSFEFAQFGHDTVTCLFHLEVQT